MSKHQSLKGLAERFRSDSHLGIKKNERPERGTAPVAVHLDRLICGPLHTVGLVVSTGIHWHISRPWGAWKGAHVGSGTFSTDGVFGYLM